MTLCICSYYKFIACTMILGQILEVATQEANKGNRDEVKQHFSKGQACVPFKELADIRRAVAGTLFECVLFVKSHILVV